MRACALCLIVMSGLRRGGGLMRVGDGLHLVNVVQVQGRVGISAHVRSAPYGTLPIEVRLSVWQGLSGQSSSQSNMLRPREEAHLTSSPV